MAQSPEVEREFGLLFDPQKEQKKHEYEQQREGRAVR